MFELDSLGRIQICKLFDIITLGKVDSIKISIKQSVISWQESWFIFNKAYIISLLEDWWRVREICTCLINTHFKHNMEWYKKPVLVRVHSAYVMLPFLWCRSLMNVCSSKFPSSWLKFYEERKTKYNYSIYWTGCVEFEFIKAISMIIIYLLKKWLCSVLSLGGHIFGLLFFSCILLCMSS